MADLNNLTLAAARDGLRKGDFTSKEITADCLAAIDGADALNAVTAKTPEKAMDMAAAADARLAQGEVFGIVAGQSDLDGLRACGLFLRSEPGIDFFG